MIKIGFTITIISSYMNLIVNFNFGVRNGRKFHQKPLQFSNKIFQLSTFIMQFAVTAVWFDKTTTI